MGSTLTILFAPLALALSKVTDAAAYQLAISFIINNVSCSYTFNVYVCWFVVAWRKAAKLPFNMRLFSFSLKLNVAADNTTNNSNYCAVAVAVVKYKF